MTVDFVPLQPTQQQTNAPSTGSDGIDFVPLAQPQQKQNPLMGVAQAIDVGGTRFGANLLGTIGRLTGNPQFSQQMQQVAQNAPQTWGMTNPSFGQKLLENASQYAPYSLLTGGMPTTDALSNVPVLGKALSPAIQAQIGTGALFGGTQSPQAPLQGAALGAGINGLIGNTGNIIGGLGSAAMNQLAKYAPMGIGQKLGQLLKQSSNLTNSQAFDVASDNYENGKVSLKNSWDNLYDKALDVDTQPNAPQFDNSSYQQSLKGQIAKLQQKASNQSGFANAYAQPISYLQKYLNDNTGSFSDAFEHNQALNQDLASEANPNTNQIVTNQTKAAIGFAKGALKNSIQQNIDDSGLQDTLGQQWNDANQATQDLKQTFEQKGTPSGGINRSAFAKFNSNQFAGADPSTFVQDYLPTAAQDGTQKMQQFVNMMKPVATDASAPTDDSYVNTAKGVLKGNLFKNAIDDNQGVNPDKFLNIYNKLSPEQSDYLFTPQESSQINALKTIAAQNGTKSNWWKVTLPFALAGGLMDQWIGGSAWKGVLGGAYIGKQYPGAMSLLAANPGIRDSIVNRLNGQSPAQGSLSQMLSPYAQGVTTPSLINQSGGR